MAEREVERRYDKGERRFKHVGRGSAPVIEFDSGEPKKWVGKCPSHISDEVKAWLLREAIPSPNGDRELSAPKRLYVVHKGAIYEAQTSDDGATYHAYPYKGKLSRSLLTGLEAMANKQGCADGFRDWVRKHIVQHGEKR